MLLRYRPFVQPATGLRHAVAVAAARRRGFSRPATRTVSRICLRRPPRCRRCVAYNTIICCLAASRLASRRCRAAWLLNALLARRPVACLPRWNAAVLAEHFAQRRRRFTRNRAAKLCCRCAVYGAIGTGVAVCDLPLCVSAASSLPFVPIRRLPARGSTDPAAWWAARSRAACASNARLAWNNGERCWGRALPSTAGCLRARIKRWRIKTPAVL